MARLSIQQKTLKALFARSGNQCAFPGCTHPVVNHKDEIITQVCHIESALEGGERFNADSNDEYRRSYDNLIILCYAHHVETNDVNEYTTERLRKIKLEHEQQFLKSDFKIDEAELQKLLVQIELYWEHIDYCNKNRHEYLDSGLAMKVNGKASYKEVLNDTYEAVNGIDRLLGLLHQSDEKLIEDFYRLLSLKGISKDIFDDVPYFNNLFENRNWDCHNLSAPNWILQLRILLTQLEVNYLFEYLKTNSNDNLARFQLNQAKKKLEKYATSAMHVD